MVNSEIFLCSHYRNVTLLFKMTTKLIHIFSQLMSAECWTLNFVSPRQSPDRLPQPLTIIEAFLFKITKPLLLVWYLWLGTEELFNCATSASRCGGVDLALPPPGPAGSNLHLINSLTLVHCLAWIVRSVHHSIKCDCCRVLDPGYECLVA